MSVYKMNQNVSQSNKDETSRLKLARTGLRKLLKEGRVSAASVLACPELVSLASPSSTGAEDGDAAATVAQALRFAVEGMKERDAVGTLLGLVPSSEGESLRLRRDEAAALLGIKGESFRVRRESQLLEKLANALVVELAKPVGRKAGLPADRRPRLLLSAPRELANRVGELGHKLEDRVNVVQWSSLVSAPSHSSLDALGRALDEADFALFVLCKESFASGGERRGPSRDNVLFELGLSIGRLGLDRVFVLVPRESRSEEFLPSDLLGVTTVYHDLETGGRAVSRLARQLQDEMRARSRLALPGEVHDAERGNVDHLDLFADAAVELAGSRERYADEVRRSVRWGEGVPAKFRFANADGGRYWLRLCRDISNSYFRHSSQALRRRASRLMKTACEASGTGAIDLISLGCGDGSKDAVLLKALAGSLTDDEYLYYYPVEISDALLVEALRHITGRGFVRSRLKCKPILGDFTNLQAFSSVIDYRPNANLFSILGNTIGSFDEQAILSSLERVLKPGDLVLIEANTGRAEESLALLEDDASVEWNLSTLDALGIPRDSCELGSEFQRDVSIVPGTETLLSYATPQGKDHSARYALSAIHHYELDQLRSSIEEWLEVEWVETIDEGEAAFLLGRRPS